MEKLGVTIDGAGEHAFVKVEALDNAKNTRSANPKKWPGPTGAYRGSDMTKNTDLIEENAPRNQDYRAIYAMKKEPVLSDEDYRPALKATQKELAGYVH